MSEILRIKDLWGGYKEGVDILRGIDMTVQEGEAVGIIGLNGSGKSTLGKAIMNMIPFRRGEILFDGEDVTGLSTCELVRKGISIMQQGGQVFPNLSVWENLELAFSSRMGSEFDRLRDIIPILRSPKKELQHRMADKLSGGQKHQLALAMTLATRPRLVILDEPSAGLSPKAVEEMYEMLRDVRKQLNATVLLIEQNVEKAVSFCCKSVLIKHGLVWKEYQNDDLHSIEATMFDGTFHQNSYSSQFWDNIYKHHYDDAPWMMGSWQGAVFDVIDQFMPDNAQSLLDYGCGNGFMGYHYYLKGFHVDLADISEFLIEKLRIKYHDSQMGVFRTDTPADLLGRRYDIIIAWSVFHHINPLDWTSFLKSFWDILNENGIMVIGGWDISDVIIKMDGKKARYTGSETWYLNSLVDYIDTNDYSILKNDTISFSVPTFDTKRISRCFVLKKKTNDSNL